MQITQGMSYSTRFIRSLSEIGAAEWDALVLASIGAAGGNPFLRHAFLHSLHESGAACKKTGWDPHYLTIWQERPSAAAEASADSPTLMTQQLVAALPLYVKSHSYGEYVFDWAWADAYARHGLDYYPKLLSAIPFTPVSGPRLLAVDAAAQAALLAALRELTDESGVSSCHVLFAPQAQAEALAEAGFLLRQGVQFHWQNREYADFEHFLATLEHKKRKNIRAERRKVIDAGVRFRHLQGGEASEADWALFTRCYNHTYAAHHSSPYLNLEFFLRIAQQMPENVLLIIAEQGNEPIAASLLIYDQHTLYGRYWGALKQVPCLHFETAYYQPLAFCIAQQIRCFEGGAQGEHKMARALLPTPTHSAHWLAHPAFSEAVARFLEREKAGVDNYLEALHQHSPLKTPHTSAP